MEVTHNGLLDKMINFSSESHFLMYIDVNVAY